MLSFIEEVDEKVRRDRLLDPRFALLEEDQPGIAIASLVPSRRE